MTYESHAEEEEETGDIFSFSIFFSQFSLFSPEVRIPELAGRAGWRGGEKKEAREIAGKSGSASRVIKVTMDCSASFFDLDCKLHAPLLSMRERLGRTGGRVQLNHQ